MGLRNAGYNSSFEYIPDIENTCSDLLSRKPDTDDQVIETESFELDINDNTFEFGGINSNEINPKDFAG